MPTCPQDLCSTSFPNPGANKRAGPNSCGAVVVGAAVPAALHRVASTYGGHPHRAYQSEQAAAQVETAGHRFPACSWKELRLAHQCGFSPLHHSPHGEDTLAPGGRPAACRLPTPCHTLRSPCNTTACPLLCSLRLHPPCIARLTVLPCPLPSLHNI